MFRIKNVRNATVAKQNQFSPVPAPRPPPPPSLKLRRVPTPQSKKAPKVQARPSSRVQVPHFNHKVTLVTKTHAQEQFFSKKVPEWCGKSGKANPQIIKPSKKENNPLPQKQEKDKRYEQVAAQLSKREEEQGSMATIVEFLNQEKGENKEREELLDFVKREEQARGEKLQIQLANEKEKKEREEKRQREEQQREQEERRKQKRQLQKKIEKQQQEGRERQLHQMMQKVQARRKAREQQRLKRLKMEEAMAQQQRKMEQPISNPFSGLISVSDPLAHIEMSEKIMDKQVQLLLNMNFAGYSNQAALTQQLDELQGINRSYLLVREDPSNPLLRGLAHFRVQLFNRVGELVIEGQKSMGSNASGLRVVEGDYLQRGAIEGVKMTRGLQGHVRRLLQTKRLQQDGECPICLDGMQVGEEVYLVNCGHLFHKQCLQDWLTTTANCPACRYNIKYDHP